MNRMPQDTLLPAAPRTAPLPADSAAAAPAAPSSSAAGFSVSRILEALPADATPAQQDSAVQANLPARPRFLSQRPDTLGLPGLETRAPWPTLECLPVAYRESFFAGNVFYEAGGSAASLGMVAEPLPYTLRRDDGVTALLLLGFFFLIFVIASGRRFFRQPFKEFFFAPRRRAEAAVAETGSEKRHRAVLMLQTSLVLGLFFFDYAQESTDLFMGRLSPHVLLAVHAAVCLAYFGAKHLLYDFVNWIFFDKALRQEWIGAYRFLLTAEGTLFFPLALVTVYFDLPLNAVGWGLAVILLAAKLLLLGKTFSIFFRKIHGVLHLFVYFCALELMPLLALCKILVYITSQLTVKY